MGMATTILSNHPGPLPISVQYTPQSEDPVTLIFSGSMWTGNLAEQPIGFELKINGESIGQSMICSDNAGNFHFTTVPAMVDTKLPFIIKDKKLQPVTIELTAMGNDNFSNENDFFNLCVIN